MAQSTIQIQKMKNKPKLEVEMVPSSTWGINLRSALKRSDWDLIRRDCYKAAGYVCEICGGTGPTHPVECHERWKYDDKKHIQKLVGVISLCPLCHKAKHLGRTQCLEESIFDDVIRHIRKVNKWSKADLDTYLIDISQEYELRDGYTWVVDMNWAAAKLDEIHSRSW